jgi:hypothetical protein
MTVVRVGKTDGSAKHEQQLKNNGKYDIKAGMEQESL